MDAIEFYKINEDKLKDYGTAAASAELYSRYFKSLLQDIESYSLDNVKRFSLLLIASHQIVHVSISSDAFYQLLKRAYNEKFNVPDTTVVFEISSIRSNIMLNGTKILFEKNSSGKKCLISIMYSEEDQEFSIAQDTSKSTNVCFGYGFETDNHMISLRFLVRRLDPSNWTRGLCTLSKEPTGLFLNDRIIGIDPGHRDLVTCVDTDSELTTKTLRKAHSFSISNAQYQKKAVNIQAIYDLIPSPKVFCRFKFMEYISVISATRNRHRENKGYTLFSESKFACDRK
ncbi:hypothetical protein BCV71DRAFT_240262 [Rhizopus microsporus]|uniref:Uncharacterized protein n=1 Tax=Rhizopus microsporus TaxID=58291 RepID=A0A1X0RJS8_RHIZD|nr:hypothetical protein BCV71DRAFT_240262 [Rhizopus microsporus]